MWYMSEAVHTLPSIVHQPCCMLDALKSFVLFTGVPEVKKQDQPLPLHLGMVTKQCTTDLEHDA